MLDYEHQVEHALKTERYVSKELWTYLLDVKSGLNDVSKLFEEVEKDINNLKSDVKSYIEQEKRYFLRFLESIKSEDAISMLKISFDSLYNQALLSCEKMTGDTEITWTEILREVNDFRRTVYEKVEQFKLLPSDQSQVLFELIRQLLEKGYIDLVQTVEEVSRELSKSEQEIYKLITKLVEKKLIYLGISYPF